MPKFSESSLRKLGTVDIRLTDIFHRVIEWLDFTILEGERGKKAQDAAFYSGKSKVKFPDSNHNTTPSSAADIAPYPVEWPDLKGITLEQMKEVRKLARFYYLAGAVKQAAHEKGVKIRCGCDWDGDNIFNDQNFHDLPHHELR